MKSSVALMVLLATPWLAVAEPKHISEPAEIAKIVSKIPVTDRDFGYKHIGERMINLGMKIDFVSVDRVEKEDAEPPFYLAGDQVIIIRTSEPNAVVHAICPIAGDPKYVMRGKKIIPNNLTAAWLMTNRCAFK